MFFMHFDPSTGRCQSVLNVLSFLNVFGVDFFSQSVLVLILTPVHGIRTHNRPVWRRYVALQILVWPRIRNSAVLVGFAVPAAAAGANLKLGQDDEETIGRPY